MIEEIQEQKESEVAVRLVPQPINIKVSLFNHQLSSIYKMEALEKSERLVVKPHCIKTKVGFLSDLLGYGKTLSILGLIARDNMPWNCDYPYITRETSGSRFIKCDEIEFYRKLNANLVILPPILVSQWEKELEKTTLNYATICKIKHVELIDPRKYEIILCDQRYYNDFTSRFSRYAWKRIILDEPGMLKTSLRTSIAGFYWFVTYTYSEFLFKRKGKFFSDIFSNLDTEILKNIVIKNDDSYVKESFKMPEIKHCRYSCYQPLVPVLNGIVSDTIVELISAGNLDKAIKMLGGDRENTNIINLIIKKKLRKIEKYTRNDSQVETKNEKKKAIEAEIQELENRFKTLLSSECPICLEKMINPTLIGECHHFFCNKCIEQWTKSSCPLCRADIDSKKFIFYQTTELENKSIMQLRTKQETINDIITSKKERNTNSKFIIFSNHDETFNNLKLFFADINIKYGDLKGKIEQKESVLRDFKTGKIDVLFLNAKESGAGLNLQETTDIILYHKMNEEAEVQIIGRANRIGRKESLYVHHLHVC